MEEIAQQAFGDALFSLALERNQLKVWRREAGAVAEILKKEEAFVALVSGPWPEKELRIKLLREVFGERVSPELLEWMTLAAEQGVFCHIQAMIGRFVRKADRQLQKEQVTVTAPGELSVAQRKRVERCLNRSIGVAPEDIRYRRDASLIGGMTARIGDQVLDGSVRTRLRRMKEELLTWNGKAGEESR